MVLSDRCYLDPWGNPYVIVMDTDFDGQIGGFKAIVGTGMGYNEYRDHARKCVPERQWNISRRDCRRDVVRPRPRFYQFIPEIVVIRRRE